MSLEKAIKHGKEHRKGYRERGKPGEFDRTCRPHGGGTSIICKHCLSNRFHRFRKTLAAYASQDEKLG